MNNHSEEYILLVPGNYTEEFEEIFKYVRAQGLDIPEEKVIIADDMEDAIEIAIQFPIKLVIVTTNTEKTRRQLMWVFHQLKHWGKIPNHKLEGIELDPITRIVIADGKRIRLSKIENETMELFIERPGMVLDTEFILNCVWGPEETDTSLVRGIISRLRKKIEIDSENPKWIITHDNGYSLGEC